MYTFTHKLLALCNSRVFYHLLVGSAFKKCKSHNNFASIIISSFRLLQNLANLQNMLKTFLYIMHSHVSSRLAGNDDIVIPIMYAVLQFMKRLADIPFNLVADYGIANLFAYGKTDAEILLLRFLQNINDKLAVRYRLPFFKSLLELFILFHSEIFFHLFNTFNSQWIRSLYKGFFRKSFAHGLSTGIHLSFLSQLNPWYKQRGQ